MSQFDSRYDIALSYSRDDRERAHAIAAACRDQGIRVFFDQWAVPQVWGEELLRHLYDLHLSTARYCVPLLSCNYVSGMSTTHGPDHPGERSLEGDTAHLLPVRLDDSYVPALRLPGPYLDLRNTGPAEIARLLRKKLDQAAAGGPESLGSHVPGYRADLEPAPPWVPGFERIPVTNRPTITEPEILEMLDRIGPASAPRKRLRFGNDLQRMVSLRRILYCGPVYTAWRSGDRVYLSMLPSIEHGFSARHSQLTLEFEVYGTPPEGLALVAEWQARDPAWNQIDYAQIQMGSGYRVADRSGCSMAREAALNLLAIRGARFTFPVAPVSGPPERFCRWTPASEALPEEASEWDRDPQLVHSQHAGLYAGEPWIGIDGLGLLHPSSGTAVMITTLKGGWTVGAVYALQDALDLLLPTRHVLRPLEPGCLRLCVFLARLPPASAHDGHDGEAYDRNRAFHAIRLAHAALARAVAAQREIPVAPPCAGPALPRLHPKVGKVFRACEEALGKQDGPDLSSRAAEAGSAAWEVLADTFDGRRLNIRAARYPFDVGQLVTRADLAAYIETCE